MARQRKTVTTSIKPSKRRKKPKAFLVDCPHCTEEQRCTQGDGRYTCVDCGQKFITGDADDDGITWADVVTTADHVARVANAVLAVQRVFK